MVNGSDLFFPFGEPFHCYWFPTFQFYVILVIWLLKSIFSPSLASLVPKVQPNQAACLILGLPSQDQFCSGPLPKNEVEFN